MNCFSTFISSFSRKMSKLPQILILTLFLLVSPLLFYGNVLGLGGRPPHDIELSGISFSVIYEPTNEPSTEMQTAWMQISGSGEAGPVGNEIQDLAIGPSGALWVATNSGLSRLSNGRFRHFTRKNGMPHNQVFTVITAGRGVFAGTKEGLVWFDDLAPLELISPIVIKNLNGAVNSIFRKEDEFLFLITPHHQHSKLGRLKLDTDGTPEQNSLITRQFNTLIRRLLPGGENWVFCQLPDRQWIQCEISKNSENGAEVKLGKLLDVPLIDVATAGDEKLLLMKDTLYQQKNIKISKSLLDFDTDDYSEGFLAPNRDRTNIWLGKGENLWLIDPLTGKTRSYFKLYPNMKLKTVAEGVNGCLWVGTENHGILMSVPDKKIGWMLPFTKAIVNFDFELELDETIYVDPLLHDDPTDPTDPLDRWGENH